MKKQLLIALLSMIVYTKTTAQKMTSDNYTVSISDLKSREYTSEAFGTKHDIIEYIGNYTIEKNGNEIASQKFSTMQIDKSTFSINIRESETLGNSLSYDFDTKKYEFMGEERKAKKTKTIEDLILSGILIYAKMSEEN